MVIRLVVLALVMSAVPVLAASSLPAPPAPKDTADLGKGIQRAMTLMATSTPQMHHKVKVLYYGQSITNQEWTEQVSQVP